MPTTKLRAISILAGLATACATATPPGDGAATYDREVRGGNLHRDAVRGATVAATAGTTVELDQVIATPSLAPAVGALAAGDFATRVVTQRGPGGRPRTYVHAQQTVDGVPIVGAFLYLTLAPADGDGDEARLLGSSYHLFHGADVETTPSVAAADAEALARLALRLPPDAALNQRRLVIRELDGELQLVWDITARDHHARALVRAAGPRAGRIDVDDDRVYDTTGTVRGWIAEHGAPGGAGTPRLVPLAEARVWAGNAATVSAADGTYQLAPPPGATVAVAALGPAAEILNRAGSAVITSAPATARADLVLGAAAGEQVLAQTTAFAAITRTRRYLLDAGLDAGALGEPLTTRVNLPDTCNAYYAPAQRTMNLFRHGGGCNNSAEASIVIHEYGHFVDDMLGGIADGGLSEGWGDTLACFVLGAPVVGGDLYQDGSALRTCDNTYRYPASGRDEVHDLGQAWSGFTWHLRAALIAELGPARGDAVARALVLPSLASNAPDIPTAVREVFLRDDDDDDLTNGTPHLAALRAAAARHGLDGVLGHDEAPPGVVDDLLVTADSATRVTVRWSAPGDDGHRGTAARYELRWSATPITTATFRRAALAAAPEPLRAGARQQVTLDVPPLATIYVALRASDELGNTSPLSNVASVALPAPVRVYHDGAEAGLGPWAATGLWHVTERAADAGRRAFWYGREATGTYETGGRSTGTLTSPPIDLAGVTAPRLAWRELVDVESQPEVDQLRIEVFDVAAPEVRVTATKLGGHSDGFAARVLDLTPLAGRTVRVRFSVDTVDGRLDATAGWFVDEVAVLAAARPPAADGVLVINEVLADPPPGYDAGGDGRWSARDDELIELVNGGPTPLDLGGAFVSDSTTVRATLAAGTVLAPGDVLVLFGGAAPALAGVRTVATDGLYLNNDGDAVIVRRPDGQILAELRYGAEGGADQALTRARDGDATAAMVGHRTVAAQPASPGRRHDGSPFGGAP